MDFASFVALWEAGACVTRRRPSRRECAQVADKPGAQDAENPIVQVLGTYTVAFDMKQEEQEPDLWAIAHALPETVGAVDPTVVPYAVPVLDNLAMLTPALTPEPWHEADRERLELVLFEE